MVLGYTIAYPAERLSNVSPLPVIWRVKLVYLVILELGLPNVDFRIILKFIYNRFIFSVVRENIM